MVKCILQAGLFFALLVVTGPVRAEGGRSFDLGPMKPVDSVLKVKPGDRAPDFTLPSISGESVGLSDYLGKKNVVLSFVPAAWTPVCSQQWPDFNRGRELFDKHDAVLLGITVDNIPTLAVWAEEMGGLGFPVLSDFRPHGAVAEKYGVLRSDGMSERAFVYIDKQGIIRGVEVGDINKRPLLTTTILMLSRLNRAEHDPAVSP